VIAATHQNLEKLIVYGKFRRDLFHRINRFPIVLPPLRERREDIPLLANHFLVKYEEEVGKPRPEISREAMIILENQEWKGNIRELKNVIERVAIVSENGIIGPKDLEINHNSAEKNDVDSIRLDIQFPVREFSLDVATEKIKEIILAKCGGNKSKAAEMLKINRKQFYER
jgi:DNA-binding NtrC family response regulator